MISGVNGSWKFMLSVISLFGECIFLGQVENAKHFVLSLLKGNFMACNCDDVDKTKVSPNRKKISAKAKSGRLSPITE